MASIQNTLIRAFLKKASKSDKAGANDVETIRKRIGGLMSAAPKPFGVSFEKVDCNGVTAEWNTPKNVNTEGVVLYIHGGAYIACSIGTHRPLVARIAKASRTKCLSVEYGLAPENPYPKGLDDVTAVYNWLLEQGYSSNKIVIMGDSAGGGMALSTTLRLRDNKAQLPGAVVCMSPWINLACDNDSNVRLAKKDVMLAADVGKVFAKMYAGNESVTNPSYVSPYYADVTGMPPMYIQISDSEIIYDENVEFAQKLKDANVDVKFEIWEDMVHVWQGFAAVLPEAKQALKKLGTYINEKTK